MAVFLGKLTIYLYFLDEPSEISFEFSVSENLK